jgi:hypothetical protein
MTAAPRRSPLSTCCPFFELDCDGRSWATRASSSRRLAEAHLTAVVYDPPASGLPHIAVLFDAAGDVIAVRTAASIDEGEAALAKLIADISAAQHATA